VTGRERPFGEENEDDDFYDRESERRTGFQRGTSGPRETRYHILASFILRDNHMIDSTELSCKLSDVRKSVFPSMKLFWSFLTSPQPFSFSAKQKVERQLNSLKKTVDEEKKKREDFGSKSSITPIDRQHTKILLALQQANNDLKEAQLVIQSVQVESSSCKVAPHSNQRDKQRKR